MPLDFIVPYFYSSHRGSKKDCEHRLISCLQNVGDKENVIVVSDEQNKYKNPNINTHYITKFGITNASVRNIAANISKGHNIFFLDADLIINPSLLMHLKIKGGCTTVSPVAFEMYPCLYLTKEETERFDGDFQGCLESFLRGENHRVEGIALASSCLLMNREWFLQLGGFDERFVGHGGEDLELIDRLTRHYPIGPRPDDYALNIKAQHPGDYQGFRRYFSYYALPHLFAGRFLVHQWHPRPLTHPYHRRRAGNDAMLEQMLALPDEQRAPLRGPVVPNPAFGGALPDFREWMIGLQEAAGYPVADYPGLLRWQEGVTRHRPLWRKLRKLYLNPGAFFRDMFQSKSRAD